MGDIGPSDFIVISFIIENEYFICHRFIHEIVRGSIFNVIFIGFTYSRDGRPEMANATTVRCVSLHSIGFLIFHNCNQDKLLPIDSFILPSTFNLERTNGLRYATINELLYFFFRKNIFTEYLYGKI